MSYDELSDRVKQALAGHEPSLTSLEKLHKFKEAGNDWNEIRGIGPAAAKELDQVLQTAMRNDTSDTQAELPRLFISHQDDEELDIAIANHLRTFFETNTGKSIDVFQSSHGNRGLSIGEPIPDGLGRRLKVADVVLLIYTNPDHDWGYCLWETGLSADPENPGMPRIAVLTCCGAKPNVFRDKQIIDVGKKEHIRKFVNDALADSEFWPRYGKALTSHTKDSRDLHKIAGALHDKLQELVPSSEPTSEWLFWPSLRLYLPFHEADSITQLLKDDDQEQAREIVWSECTVASETDVGRMLGLETVKDKPLRDLRDSADSADWVEALCEMLVSAAAGRWPEPRWPRVRDNYVNCNRVAIMYRRDKIPAKQRFSFHVHFPQVPDADGSG